MRYQIADCTASATSTHSPRTSAVACSTTSTVNYTLDDLFRVFDRKFDMNRSAIAPTAAAIKPAQPAQVNLIASSCSISELIRFDSIDRLRRRHLLQLAHQPRRLLVNKSSNNNNIYINNIRFDVCISARSNYSCTSIAAKSNCCRITNTNTDTNDSDTITTTTGF